MRVSVVCFGVMREYLPGPHANSATVELRDGGRVSDLLTQLAAPERLVQVCLVDGRRVGLDEELREGSEVTLMPPFSGG